MVGTRKDRRGADHPGRLVAASAGGAPYLELAQVGSQIAAFFDAVRDG
ncbi:MAG TPA: hypothetical protein VGE14_10075 [Marmoricola sp.]